MATGKWRIQYKPSRQCRCHAVQSGTRTAIVPHVELFPPTSWERDTAMFHVILLAFCRVQYEAPPHGKISQPRTVSIKNYYYSRFLQIYDNFKNRALTC